MNATSIDFEAMLGSLQLASAKPTEFQLLHMKHMVERARPYNGQWEFPWLLNSWHATTWETSNGNKTRKDQHGNWIDTEKTHWDWLLPDGCRLTDPPYAKLLETCRRVSALFRSGYATPQPPCVSTWAKFNRDILNICHWMVLHKNRYSCAEEGFKQFDQFGLKQLLLAIARGGWCAAHSIVERCLIQLHLQVSGHAIPQNILDNPANLPPELCDRFTAWLQRNEGFAKVHGKNTGLVSRTFIEKLISADSQALQRHAQLNAVLRQFEVRHQDDSILVSGSKITEFARHTTPLTVDIMSQSASYGTVKQLAGSFRQLFALYRHIPDQLPCPTGFRLVEASSVARSRSAARRHTPFLPIDIGLKYLNIALKWIVLYGDALIDYFLLIIKKFATLKSMSKNSSTFKITSLGRSEKIFARTPLPQVLRDAGFSFSSYTTPNTKAQDFTRLREKPSLDEALGVLIGAVTITIGLLKPSRDLEIVNLQRDCLSCSLQGFYWLNSPLGKRARAEQRAFTGGRPIPFITARAISQICRLNDGLTKIFDEKDAYKKSKLFYLPNPKKFGSSMKLNSGVLNGYLDLFCDFVGMPPDQYGRRWYIRIHEMRKWFLLLLFWSGRYDVLDAGRWIAGHTNAQHLYDYIQREFPETQLGKLEAECAIDHLALYDETQIVIDGESVGLVQLYERVLNHFRVSSLSLIKESDWHLLVEELFENEYHLEPHTISADGGSERLCVAVRIGPRKEAAK